ncbi:MAG: uracil-DNA glycosylase [Campylobacteraceae bacterium]|jgi:DNA polymerase|nr:uracil-DNA glycosylase [Campylobacteraceae bacterium]
MSTLEKLKTLKELYMYRAMGFEYYKESKEIKSEPNNYMPEGINELRQTVLKCYLCQLCKGRKNVVFGEGNTKAKLMFIGEGPGASEDASGRPFVGQAGQLLTKIIENVLNLKRDDVYIANIVKCRPPQNRAPTYEEASICRPYLFKQIEIINPSVIVALGSTSFRYLTDDETPISRVRGEIIKYKNAKLIPTFHPSYLLRTPSAKKDVWRDMLKVKGLL